MIKDVTQTMFPKKDEYFIYICLIFRSKVGLLLHDKYFRFFFGSFLPQKSCRNTISVFLLFASALELHTTTMIDA